jgi:sugar transferase (PEP-CTERM/EpsH1 system associated)
MPELLFLCHRIPYPPDKGERIRAWHVLKHLARTHRVHLGALADDPADSAHLDELRRLCFRVGSFPVRQSLQKLRALAALADGRPLTAAFFYSPALARWVASTFERYPIDRLYVFSSAMVRYAIDRRAAMRVLDLVDIDSEKWRAYARYHRWPVDALYRREAERLLALERQAVLDFDATLFVSEAEARCFLSLAPECEGRVGWLENGVDLERFSPEPSFASPYAEGSANVVFIGRMDYWPNVDAVVWFAEEVVPLLRKAWPAVRFHIVGAAPTRRVLRLHQPPGIFVTGRVADVRPFLAHAEVAVAPLRVARGLQNKVLEAMAMARPVVATPAAFEGLRAVPGRDLLLCTTAEEMASRICEVLAGRHSELGAAARLAVERHHDWSRNLQHLDSLFPPQERRQEQEEAAVALGAQAR